VDSASGADFWRGGLSAGASVVLVGSIGLLELPLPLAVPVLGCAVVLSYWAPLGGIGAVLFMLPWFFHPILIESQRFPASELLLLCAAVGISVARLRAAVLSRDIRARLARIADSIARSPLIWASALLAVTGLLLALRPYDVTHGPIACANGVGRCWSRCCCSVFSR
jgi:hypothetical protein